MPSKTTSDLCCPHPSRALSPTEPARPAIISLDGIFAVAALPEDDPHALKMPERRPGSKLAKSLIKSPSVVGKLKSQLKRRKTIRSLRAEVYDEDARRIGSEEVLEAVERAEGKEGPGKSPLSDVQGACDSRDKSTERLQPAAVKTEASPAGSPLKVPVTQLRDLTPPELNLSAYQLDGGLVILATTPEATTPELKSQAKVDDSGLTLNDHTTPKPGRTSSTSLRLANMRISQQLRSMSQMSEFNHDEERLTPEIWTLHHREHPEGRGFPSRESTSTKSHHRPGSSTGVDSSKVPETWGRVQQNREERDTSSSIYSRGVSTDVPGPYELPGDPGNWPLADALSPNMPQGDGQQSADSSCTPSEPVRAEPTNASAAALIAPTGLPTSRSTVSFRSNVSHGSKATRFTKSFTPPKKTVKKRRSFFKFLRASSRRQTRSISTPVLRTNIVKPSFDGTNEGNDTVTVQYELDQTQPTANRSVSLGNLASPRQSKTSITESAGEYQRKMSLAEYERHLSINGDDRRRPSTQVMRLSEIHEDGPPVQTQSKKSLSQRSKRRDSDSLMQSALERHVKEKALMQSPSKRSIGGSTLSFAATAWDEPISASPTSPSKDILDSVEPSQAAPASESDIHLSPPRTPVDDGSRRSSLNHQPQIEGKKPVVLQTPISTPQRTSLRKSRSPLAAWSRYPSHTRDGRCGSAGPSDRVTARDFSIEITHGDVGGSDETDPFHPGKKTFTGFSSAKSSRSSKHHFPKSRSATFGAIARYYSNIFSNPDFHLKGRRTSLATSGQLKDPELEVLPPMLPPSSQSQPILGKGHHEVHRGSRLSHIKHHFNHGTNKLVDRYSPGQHHRVFTDPATQPIGPIQFRQYDIFHDIAKSQANESLESDAAYDTTASGALSAAKPGSLLPDKDEPISPKSTIDDSTANDRQLRLDGTAEKPDGHTRSSPSKAEMFSEAYQECVVRPTSCDETKPVHDDAEAVARAMMPPPLRSRKRNSPESKQDHLDPNATVRRFPSVTVVDDRKGHWRSVSFVSVKSNKSGNSFVREKGICCS